MDGRIAGVSAGVGTEVTDLGPPVPDPSGPEERGRPPLPGGLSYAALSFVVNIGLSLVSSIVTARLYGVEVIGEYGLAMTTWLLLVSFSTVSEQVALRRELATEEPGSRAASQVFFAVFTMSQGLTTLMAGPVLLLSAALLDGAGVDQRALGPAALIIAGYVLFENPAWNLDSVLSAFGHGGRLFWCRLTTVGGFFVLAVLFRLVTESVWALAWANVGSFALGLLARLVLVRGVLGGVPTRAEYRDGLRQLPALVRFGLRLVPGQVFVGLTAQLPVWIVARGVLAQVGAYSRASTLAGRLSEAGFRVNEMLFPDLVRHGASGDLGRLARSLGRVLRLTCGALLLVAAVGGSAAEAVMNVFGEGFSDAAGALAYLLLAQVVFVVSSLVGGAFNALGRPQLNSILSSIRLVAGAVLVFTLHDRFGLTGAAAGLFAANGLELAMRLIVVRRLLGSAGQAVLGAVDLGRLGLTFVAGFLAGITVSQAVGADLVGLLCAAVAASIAYGAVGIAVGVVDADERRGLVRRARVAAGRLRGLPA